MPAESTAPGGADRRGVPDRRVRRAALRYPERRTGFERRRDGRRRGVWAAYEQALAAYRDAPQRLALVLAAFVALNVADVLLTARALERGATEANPIMAGLLSIHPGAAAGFKLVAVAAATLVIWRLRRYRRILEASLLLVGAFALLTLYHLVGAAVLAS